MRLFESIQKEREAHADIRVGLVDLRLVQQECRELAYRVARRCVGDAMESAVDLNVHCHAFEEDEDVVVEDLGYRLLGCPNKHAGGDFSGQVVRTEYLDARPEAYEALRLERGSIDLVNQTTGDTAVLQSKVSDSF